MKNVDRSGVHRSNISNPPNEGNIREKKNRGLFSLLENVAKRILKSGNRSAIPDLSATPKQKFIEFPQVSGLNRNERHQWLNQTDAIEQYVLFKVADRARGWVDRVGQGSLRISAKGVSSLSPEKLKNPLKNYKLISQLGGSVGGAYGKVGLYEKLDSNGNPELSSSGKPKQYAIKTGAFKDPDLYGGNVTELKTLLATLNNNGNVVQIRKATIADGQIHFFLELLKPFVGTKEEWLAAAPSPCLNANVEISDRRPDNTALRDDRPVHIDLGQLAYFDEAGVNQELRARAVDFGVKNIDRLDSLLPRLYPSGQHDYIEQDIHKLIDDLKTEILSRKNELNH